MKAILTTILSSIIITGASAQYVRLDSTFHNTGAFVLDTSVQTLPQITFKHALQPDGKIVFCSNKSTGFFVSDVTIGRLKPNGTFDSTFGTNGTVTLSAFAGGFNMAVGLAIQPNGKIVTGGMANDGFSANQIFIAQLNSNGTLDASFGNSGITTYDINDENERVTDLKIQRNGKILMSGIASTSSASDSSFIVRVNTNGSLDNGFAQAGILRYQQAGRQTNLYAIDVDSTGKIVAGGSYSTSANFQDFLLIRLDSNGAFDNTFGTGGITVADFSHDYDEIHSLKILTNQSIVAAGYSYNGFNDGVALIKVTATGIFDNTFGTGGREYIGDTIAPMRAYSMQLQADGKIVLGGYRATSSGTNNLLLMRLQSNGTADTSFYPATGYITTDFFGDEDKAHSVSIQQDGKIVVFGTTVHNVSTQEEQPVIARYVTKTTVVTPPNTAVPNTNSTASITVYPSPVYGNDVHIKRLGQHTITARLYSNSGALVQQNVLNVSSEVLQFNPSLINGNYFLLLTDEQDSITTIHKIILQRN